MLHYLKSWAYQLRKNILTLWFALKNPQTPLHAKALAFVTVAYALSPIDLIPDFIPVLGLLDDVILVPVLIWLAVKLIPKNVLDDSQKQAQEWWSKNQSKPKSRLGAFIVIAIWLLVIWLTLEYLFFR